MDHIKIFEIKFNYNKVQYKPGEIISGKCIIELDDAIYIRALYITIQGTAMVCWTYTSENKFLIHSDSNNIFSQIINLHTIEACGENKLLSKGKHEFLFTTKIPINHVLSSFKGKYGSINYIIKAHLISDNSKKQFAKKNYKCTADKFLKIICPLNIDLSENQTLIQKNVQNNIGCICCPVGQVSINAKLNKHVYNLDDDLLISAEFENLTSRTMKPYVLMFQIQRYTAPNDSKEIRQRVLKYKDSCFKEGKISWTDKQLRIPVVTPSILSCRILQIEYCIEVGLSIKGFSNIFVELPLAISVAVDQVETDFNVAIQNPITTATDASKPIPLHHHRSNRSSYYNETESANIIFMVDSAAGCSQYDIMRRMMGDVDTSPPTYQQSVLPPPSYSYTNQLLDEDGFSESIL